MSQKLDNMEIGYLYFDAKDYLFRKSFLNYIICLNNM